MESGKILKLMKFKLKKIRSDASFREFFRLYKGKKTSIIVTAKKERFKNLIAYSAINEFLKTIVKLIIINTLKNTIKILKIAMII